LASAQRVPPTAAAASAPASTDDDRATPNRTVPYVIGGVGVGLVAISGLFGLRFLNDNAEAKDICSGAEDACPRANLEHHASLLSSARGARKAGFVTLALGLVGVGVSAVWLVESMLDEVTGAAQRVALSGQLGSSEALLECAIPF